MHSHLTHSETPRTVVATDPKQNDMHPGRGVITLPTHDAIAHRAYAIYVTSGCKQGQCKQNWHQAELELRRDDHRP